MEEVLVPTAANSIVLDDASESGPVRTYWMKALNNPNKPPFVAVFYSETEQEAQMYNVFTGGAINAVYLTSPLMKHIVYGFKQFKGKLNEEWMKCFFVILNHKQGQFRLVFFFSFAKKKY